MKSASLMAFYFGTLSDAERLEVERLMLTDPEVLLDYLDMKRSLESAQTFPEKPSPAVWARLSRRLDTMSRPRRTFVYGFAAAALALILTLVLLRRETPPATDLRNGILFDSGREPGAGSHVL